METKCINKQSEFKHKIMSGKESLSLDKIYRFQNNQTLVISQIHGKKWEWILILNILFHPSALFKTNPVQKFKATLFWNIFPKFKSLYKLIPGIKMEVTCKKC